MLAVLQGYLDDNGVYVDALGIIPDVACASYGSYKDPNDGDFYMGFILDFDSEHIATGDIQLTDEQEAYIDTIFCRKMDTALELYPELIKVEANTVSKVLLPFNFLDHTYNIGGRKWIELHVVPDLEELNQQTWSSVEADELTLRQAFQPFDQEREEFIKSLNLSEQPKD